MSAPAVTSGRAKAAGLIVLIAGVWGGLIPFVGPTFGYDMGNTAAWVVTESRVTLHLVPGIVAVIGGAMLLGRGTSQTLGATLGTAAGVWFVIVPSLHPLWAGQSMGGGMMGGSALSNALSALGYHYGTGALVMVAAAYAWGALSSRRPASVSTSDHSRSVERESTLSGSRG